MARYLNTIYGTDTYGIRIRQDISFTATAINWTTIKLTFGDIPTDYPVGTRILVTRNDGYWSPLPYDNNGPPHAEAEFQTLPNAVPPGLFSPEDFITADPSTRAQVCILPRISAFSAAYGKAFQPGWEDNVLYTHIVGGKPMPKILLDAARPGTVTYYRIYACEPAEVGMASYGDGLVEHLLEEQSAAFAEYLGLHEDQIVCRWTPWVTCGEQYVVTPANHKSVETLIDAIPTGLMTGGDVYGVIDENSTQYKYLSHIGFLSDLIQTDGALIVDTIDFLHPNMVTPLLRGFGMTEDEFFNINSYYAAWDRFPVSPYLKTVLFDYRDNTMRKGTKRGFSQYYESAFRTPDITICLPENLILTTMDSSPADFMMSGQHVVSENPTVYRSWFKESEHSQPRLPETSISISPFPTEEGTATVLWTRQYTGSKSEQLPPGTPQGLWADIMTESWNVGGPQDSFIIGNDDCEGVLIPKIIDQDDETDTWRLRSSDIGDYEQHVDFVYQLQISPGTPVRIGSAQAVQQYQDLQTVGNRYSLAAAPQTQEELNNGLVVETVMFDAPDTMTSIYFSTTPSNIWFRFKALRQERKQFYPNNDSEDPHAYEDEPRNTVLNVVLYFDWMDSEGQFLGREYPELSESPIADLNASPNTWVPFVYLHRPPRGARYLSWGINALSDDNGAENLVLCLGAFHCSTYDLVTYPTYRDPRSIVILAEYPSLADASEEPPPPLEIINAAKIAYSAGDRLPAHLNYRLLTNLDVAEFDEFNCAPLGTGGTGGDTWSDYLTCLQNSLSDGPTYIWPMTTEYVHGSYSQGWILDEVIQGADGVARDVETDWYTSTAILNNGVDSSVFASDVALPITPNIMDSFTVSFLIRAADERTFSRQYNNTESPWWWIMTARAATEGDTDRSGWGLGWENTSQYDILLPGETAAAHQGSFFFDDRFPIDPPYKYQLNQGDMDPYEKFVDSSNPLSGTSDHVMAWRWDAGTDTMSMWCDGVKVSESVISLNQGNFPLFELIVRTFKWGDNVNDKWNWMSYIVWWDHAVSDETLSNSMTMALNGGCGGTGGTGGYTYSDDFVAYDGDLVDDLTVVEENFVQYDGGTGQ